MINVTMLITSAVFIYFGAKFIRQHVYLQRRNNKLESFGSILNEIKDKSYIISPNNTFRICYRCEVGGDFGLIYEKKRFRLRINESKVWVNTLPSYFYCTKCKFKSLTLKRLTKYSGDMIKNGDK